MARLIDKTYGQALFDLGLEENKIDEFATEIKAVKEAFEATPDLGDLLTHPKISREEKERVIVNSFEPYVSDDIMGFLVTVVRAGRQAAYLSIFDYFLDAVKAYKHIGVAYVKSAVELTDAQKDAVEKKLLAITDNIEYEMYYSVDESLIGGMVIRIGDKVVDSSVKTKLETMTQSLLKIQLSD